MSRACSMDSRDEDEPDSTLLLAARSRLFRTFITALFISEAICFVLAMSATLLAKSIGSGGWAAIGIGLGVGYYADHAFDFLWPLLARWHYRQVGWGSLAKDGLYFLGADKAACVALAIVEGAVATYAHACGQSEPAVVAITLTAQLFVYCPIFAGLSLVRFSRVCS